MITSRLLDGRVRMRHLVLVTTVAEAGTLVAAASMLHVTQPFLTRGLQELEAAVGVKLFERGPRGVTPTAEGEVFIEYAWVVLNTIRQAGEHIDQIGDVAGGSVAIGTNLATAHHLLPRAIVTLKANHPSITVTVIEEYQERLVALLNRNAVDMVIGRLPRVRSADHRYFPLYQEPMMLVVRKGHPALRTARSVADLLGYPWILPSSSSPVRSEIDDIFAANGLGMPTNLIECSTIVTTRPILVETDSVAALPLLIGADDDELEFLPIPLETIPREIGITVLTNSPINPAKAGLISALRHVAETSVAPMVGAAGSSLLTDHARS